MVRGPVYSSVSESNRQRLPSLGGRRCIQLQDISLYSRSFERCHGPHRLPAHLPSPQTLLHCFQGFRTVVSISSSLAARVLPIDTLTFPCLSVLFLLEVIFLRSEKMEGHN